MVQSLTVLGSGPNQPTASRMIPVPDVPVRPVLSLRSFAGKKAPPVPSVLDQGKQLEVTAGRIAIARALELMELQPGDKVLVPAYHCASMIDPLAWVKAEPVFYKIKADLTVDARDVEAKLDPRVKALMITHYFGFPQDLDFYRDFCDRNGLILLEDCAHSLFGSRGGRPIGSAGHYAITSLTKFLPVVDGGVLVTPNAKIDSIAMRRQGVMAGLLEALGAVQEANYYNRLNWLRPFVWSTDVAKSAIRGIWPSRARTTNPAQARSGEQGELDWSWIDIKPSAVSSAVLRYAAMDGLVKKRIANYRRLVAAFAEVPGCRPLLANLPEGVVPYMFPLWVDRLDTIFPRLEDAAVPMQRFGQFLWSGVDEKVCTESAALSKHLVQFPCHQELNEDELEWLIDSVISVMKST